MHVHQPVTTSLLETWPESISSFDLPSQPDIDAAYSVKIFLDHRSERRRSIALLALDSGLSVSRLKAAFLHTFNTSLDEYWENVRWKA